MAELDMAVQDSAVHESVGREFSITQASIETDGIGLVRELAEHKPGIRRSS